MQCVNVLKYEQYDAEVTLFSDYTTAKVSNGNNS